MFFGTDKIGEIVNDSDSDGRILVKFLTEHVHSGIHSNYKE
jgi:hypothetical protein